MDSKVISNYLATVPGYFELKQELKFRAEKAIEKGDLAEIYGTAYIFKPDDGSLKKEEAEKIRNFIENTGFDEIVSRLIEDKFLRERLAGRFVAIDVEESIIARIKLAIESGDIEKIAEDFSRVYYDRGRKLCTIDKETMIKKLEKAGVWDFIRYQIWLRSQVEKNKEDTLSV